LTEFIVVSFIFWIPNNNELLMPSLWKEAKRVQQKLLLTTQSLATPSQHESKFVW